MRGTDSEAELELTVEEAFRGGSGQSSSPARTAPVRRSTSRYRPVFSMASAFGSPAAEAQAGRRVGVGDLIITFRVRSDRRLRLDGKDIELDLPISPWEAALGASVATSAPGGPITVRVPPGSSSGRRLRLKGQGMPEPGGRPGDLFARVKIMVPPNLTDRERELFEQLKRASAYNPRRSIIDPGPRCPARLDLAMVAASSATHPELVRRFVELGLVPATQDSPDGCGSPRPRPNWYVGSCDCTPTCRSTTPPLLSSSTCSPDRCAREPTVGHAVRQGHSTMEEQAHPEVPRKPAGSAEHREPERADGDRERAPSPCTPHDRRAG